VLEHVPGRGDLVSQLVSAMRPGGVPSAGGRHPTAGSVNSTTTPNV
jgi:hypothetical protein